MEASPGSKNGAGVAEESIEDVCSQTAVEANLKFRDSNEEASGISKPVATEAMNAKQRKLPHKSGYIIKTRTTCEEDEKGYTKVVCEEYYEKEPHVEQKLTQLPGVTQASSKKRPLELK